LWNRSIKHSSVGLTVRGAVAGATAVLSPLLASPIVVAAGRAAKQTALSPATEVVSKSAVRLGAEVASVAAPAVAVDLVE
jgi:hypothetical protein